MATVDVLERQIERAYEVIALAERQLADAEEFDFPNEAARLRACIKQENLRIELLTEKQDRLLADESRCWHCEHDATYCPRHGY